MPRSSTAAAVGQRLVRGSIAPGAGSVDVTVTSPAGTSATGPQDQFSYADDPVITSITPGFGTGTGGTQVVIQGLNLCQVTGVTFGTAAASFTVTTVSPGVCSVAATSPAGTGVVTVTVTSPAGTSTARFSYLPARSSLRPAIGPGTGGTHVVIKGSNLCQATGVAFGKTAATRVSVSTQSPGVCQVAATSPAGTGVVNVTVVSPGGTSTGQQDLFYHPPIVFGSKPTSGPAAGGTKITINGGNLCQATGVEFGKVAAASFTVSTPVKGVCQVTATSPPGTGTVRVTVLSPGGHSVGPPHKPYPAGFTYR
jgi:IPT/TIG domain